VTTNSLIDKLRRRIKDDRPVHTAMRIVVSDPAITRAIAQVTDGNLFITMEGGGEQVNFHLGEPRYSTIGRLHQSLMRVKGLTATLGEDAQDQHSTLDLYPVGPLDIRAEGTALELKHHLFSDIELDEILQNAVTRHNPSFDVSDIPENEEAFVLSLAHAEVCRRQAYDVTKRRSMETEAGDLLQIASAIEESYEKDVKRLARAIISPQEAAPNTMGSGDIVVGTQYRSSLRTGRRSPFGAQSGPTAPILLEPDEQGDLEDEQVRVRWLRNSDNDFYAYELWMDTRPEVTNHINERAAQSIEPGYPSYYHYEGARIGSSQRVFRLHGTGRVGQGQREQFVSGLEPETTYYFRLFVMDAESSVASSQVVAYRTKALRTRFAQVNPASTYYGQYGDAITLNFDIKKGELTPDHHFYFGEKEVPIAIVNSFQGTVVVPAFSNVTRAKMLMIESPNGLRDVVPTGFRVS
jgi:hypothetical protein